ncbi:uncharacterized protein LOC117317394 [Pecten maximus]|uniref:uncharacterized protein LOC117317394 n=1 Tax=Pecten maximus TaxID=6579 RepID=UPI001458F94F|nr:uncharacterized protein LOC117317394 [Pecten maximus]
MAELNRNVWQMKVSGVDNKIMGDEEQLLMGRIEGSGKELHTVGGMDKEVLEEKGRQKEFLCQYCNKVFYKQKNLKVHMCIHTGEKKLQCNICGKCFIQSCHLKRHLRSHSGEKPYSCDICGNQFSQNGHLRVHLKSHFGNKNYKCEYCPMAFVQNSHLKRHMRSHMTIRPYKCDMCDKTYKFSDHLYIHLRRHTGETPYHCTFCDKAFHTSANLNAHIKIHNKYVDRKYKCQICVKKFHTNYALVKHMAVHTSDTPFTCRLCSKSFKYKGNLKHHFDVHSNDADMKLLKCVICVKRCTSFQSLKDHMLSHYEETCKTHKCEICYKTFRIKSSLQMHHSLHTGMKLAYRCLEVPCQFESKTVEEMKVHSSNWHVVDVESGLQEDSINVKQGYSETHENVSSKEGKFKCPMGCEHSFDNITDLVNHLKCHIKLEKNKKTMERLPDHSTVESCLKKTALGGCGNTIDVNSKTFQVHSGDHGKLTTRLDPVSMLIETAEQVLPSYYNQTGTESHYQEDDNRKSDKKIILIRDNPEEKNRILQRDPSKCLQEANANSKGMLLSDGQFSNSSFSAVVPEKTTSGRPKSRDIIKSHNIRSLFQTIPCLPEERNSADNILQETKPTCATIVQPFGSVLGPAVVEHHSCTTSSSTQIGENNYLSHGIGDSHSDRIGSSRENDESWDGGAVMSNPSFIIERNGNQSFVVGGHVIRMLDNSDGSSGRLQLQGENIEEIVIDERTMHELVIGTSEIPLSNGIEARFQNPDHDISYQQLSVDEVEEVIIPMKPEEDINEQTLYRDRIGTNTSNTNLNNEPADSSSSFDSPAGPTSQGEDSLVEASGRGQQNFMSSTIVQETNESKFQYVPYTTEKSVFIDSIGDHRYVLTHGEHSVETCDKKIIERQEQKAEGVNGTQNITGHSRYQTSSPRDTQLEGIEIQNIDLVQCPFCNEQFHDNNILKNHLQSHMNASEKIVVNVVMYMCHLCDTEFNSKESLKAHLQTHS